jgi:hypothetical protein
MVREIILTVDVTYVRDNPLKSSANRGLWEFVPPIYKK